MPEKIEEFLGNRSKFGVKLWAIVQEEPNGERLIVGENTTIYL
jgi:dTDP-glucose pyrophosphorylase